jgi:hypothetical protein
MNAPWMFRQSTFHRASSSRLCRAFAITGKACISDSHQLSALGR